MVSWNVLGSRRARRLVAMSVVLVGGLTAGATAKASILIETQTKAGFGQNVSYSFNGGSFDSRYAGTLETRFQTGPGPVFGPYQDSYCVDLFHVFSNDEQWMVDILPIALLEGFGGNPPAIGNGDGVGFLVETFASTVSSALEGAALQVAIWEMAYDLTSPGLDFSTGLFRLQNPSSAVGMKAWEYLSAYTPGDSGNADWLRALSHPNGRRQDFVTVPEPGTAALLGLGMAGMLGYRLRRRLQIERGLA